jgi:hypothetical protein
MTKIMKIGIWRGEPNRTLYWMLLYDLERGTEAIYRSKDKAYGLCFIMMQEESHVVYRRVLCHCWLVDDITNSRNAIECSRY